MGVSGSGKSTAGRALADALGLEFIEGDDHHPPENVSKMASGTPLGNEDRDCWIAALCEAANEGEASVIACSALNPTVRSWLTARCDRPLRFVHLSLGKDVLQARLEARSGHFMPPDLLDSQFTALDLSDIAGLLTVPADGPLEDVVANAIALLDEQGQHAADSKTRHADQGR